MHDRELTRPPVPEPLGLGALRDELLLQLCARALSDRLDGRITLNLPSGRARTFGSGELHAELYLRSFGVLWSALRRGALGFAEAYLNQDVDTPDLANVFRFFVRNRRSLEQSGRGLFHVRRTDVAYHKSRANTRAGSRRNIADHYDLGNDFYAHWLDPGMAYSSGIYLAPDMTLADAQAAKYAEVLAAMELAADDHVLEIGCGWGGFIEAAAKIGARVDAITVSQRQLNYTQARLQQAALCNRATARFQDYRDAQGTYDKIASIEMIEAVGEDHWSTYFKTLYSRLKPGGIAVVQAISIRDESYPDYRRKPDFIQRYIFPGGMLPTKAILHEQAAAVGLTSETWREFGASYARTLAEWRRHFHDQWPQISALGFDDRFKRLWDYYLTYCEVGFATGVIDVGIYRFHRPLVAHQS
ncbi:MAG: cyclopropane-fatty-acyl-phospholipid synthase family protein [Pseudomonadota bacterium]